MLSIAAQQIGPIANVLREWDPEADITQMGSWGMLYLVCGGFAGGSLNWKATIFELIPSGVAAFRKWLSAEAGNPPEIDLAIRFKDPPCIRSSTDTTT